MIRRGFLLLLTTMSASLGLECQDSRLGNCHCQNLSLRAKLELFCPSFQPQKQKLHILVEPERFVQLTCSNGVAWLDIVTNIKNLQLGDITTLKMINCPVPVDSFASMLSTMGVRNTSKVKELIFNQVQRSSQQLEGYHFADLPNLVVLELPRANIKKVDKKFFEHLPGLKTLDLTDNRGLVIDPDSFHGLKELQLFQCHSCYISELPDELFRGLDKLRRISLHDNKIKQLPLPIFNGLTSLEELKLTRNRLSSLPEGIFDTCDSLEDVDVGFNVFESLPNNLFAKNPRMKRFQMVANGACQPLRGCVPDKEKRLKLSPTTFQSGSIEEIRINHSPIKEVPETLFKGCRKLVNLTIQYSLIDELPENLFRDTEAIQLIDFSANKISKLEPGLFQGADKVKSLRFIANNLTRLDANLFSNLKKLETIHFHENHLFELPTELFGGNKRLKEIDLSHNNIHTWSGGSNVFENVATLNLAHNKMTYIPQHFHFNFLSLKLLNMSHNLLGSNNPRLIPTDDLNFLQNNGLTVDLAFNQIENVELWNERSSLSENQWRGFSLNLKGNPIKCNCWTTELKLKVEGKLQNSFKKLFTLDPSVDLRYNQESMIDCSYLNMTSLPSSLPIVNDSKLLIETNKISLNMTGNAISNLSKAVEVYTRHPTNMTHYQDIKKLVLTSNSIEHFSHACLPPGLNVLELDDNLLGSFSQADVNFFDQLIKDHGLKLKLGRNPYNCTCKSRPLFNFIKNQYTEVIDIHDVEMHCEHGDPKEQKFWKIEKLEEFCTTGLSTAEVGAIVVVLAILCVVIVLLVLWTCYSEYLIIWVYSKPCFRVLFTEDLIDQDKPYDVFLSYSHEDEAWVEQVLAAGLENPSEGGEGMQYRCCIHTRDWKVGEMIPDQIIQSVESSRRTLIVLSKAYVDSMWTKLEFRAAHTQALQDKTQRVILVVRDKEVIADKESMEEDLQRYISLNTYLDSEDPWFWQKLRYALPHRGGFRGRKRTRRETDRMELMRSQAELELGKRSPSPRVSDTKVLQKEPSNASSVVASSGPKGLTGGPRNGVVSPIQGNGVANGLSGYTNGHIGNQVVPA